MAVNDPRLVPLLACLLELLPWLKQWHNEVDPEFGERMGDYFEGFVTKRPGSSARRFPKSRLAAAEEGRRKKRCQWSLVMVIGQWSVGQRRCRVEKWMKD